MMVKAAEQEVQRGLRRAREVDEQEEIEEELSGRLRTSMVGLVEVAGPPWHDSRTGAVLDPVKVEIGMNKERGTLPKGMPQRLAASVYAWPRVGQVQPTW